MRISKRRDSCLTGVSVLPDRTQNLRQCPWAALLKAAPESKKQKHPVFTLCTQEQYQHKWVNTKHAFESAGEQAGGPSGSRGGPAPDGHTGWAVGTTRELTGLLVLSRKTLGPDCNKMSLQINEKLNPEEFLALSLNLNLYFSKELKTKA